MPPAEACVQFPAEWMQAPVFKTPNNLVQVQKMGEGAYSAAVGRETFDVAIEIDLASGGIVSATMDNPVDIIVRQCKSQLVQDSECGPATEAHIFRRIELKRVDTLKD